MVPLDTGARAEQTHISQKAKMASHISLSGNMIYSAIRDTLYILIMLLYVSLEWWIKLWFYKTRWPVVVLIRLIVITHR